MRLADMVPVVFGVNVTLTVQDVPAATPEAQVFVSANIAASVPVTEMPLTAREAVPVLVIVTTCAADVVPTGCELNARLVWFRLAAGAEVVDPEPLLPLLLPLVLPVTPPPLLPFMLPPVILPPVLLPPLPPPHVASRAVSAATANRPPGL
jgi:hypothetical protein